MLEPWLTAPQANQHSSLTASSPEPRRQGPVLAQNSNNAPVLYLFCVVFLCVFLQIMGMEIQVCNPYPSEDLCVFFKLLRLGIRMWCTAGQLEGF